ncbi:MAG: efflux RND transporter periplasmic adaptor subunit [Rickettsiales bacterium]|nr:efflux RND transporter periplasmic adaptor subunit [Rickettsiales bacterium]
MNTPYSSKQNIPFWQNPKALALIIAVVIGVWVLSGVIIPSDRASTEGVENATKAAAKPINTADLPIKIETLQAQKRARSITLNGVTEPERITLIEAETEGKVTKILHKEGALVEKGGTLMLLDVRDHRNKVTEANAVLKQRKVELNAAQKLYEKGFQSKVRLAQAEAAVASAHSQLKLANLDLSYTTIRAPYTGLIEEVLAEEGDLVGKGFNTQTVMRFVDMSPLNIIGQISEVERAKVTKGDLAHIRFSSSDEVTGKISFVASVADEDTRTFRVEIEIPNEDGKLQAGVSAEISLQSDEQSAYEVPSSVLSLNDMGAVGVKRITEDNIVKFEPVEVVSQSPNGVWIAGLPEEVRLVTDGVAFVSEGQVIDVQESVPEGAETITPESAEPTLEAEG